MSHSQWLQIAGALLILAAFVLSQANRLDPRSAAYLLLNLAGAAILAVLAFQARRWGFVLLEGVWTLVAGAGLLARGRSRDPTAMH